MSQTLKVLETFDITDFEVYEFEVTVLVALLHAMKKKVDSLLKYTITVLLIKKI